MLRAIPLLFVLVLGACSSVLSPRIDEQTGTTLAQRCVDYRATIAAYEVLDRDLSESESAAYKLAVVWVAANCPPLPEAPVAQ